MTDWAVSVEKNEPDFGKKFNPTEQYEPHDVALNEREFVILTALRKAVVRGWPGWRSFVTDAVTRGMEAEGVLRDMRKLQKPIEPLIFNKEFAYYLWPHEFEKHLQALVLADDYIKYLKDTI